MEQGWWRQMSLLFDIKYMCFSNSRVYRIYYVLAHTQKLVSTGRGISEMTIPPGETNMFSFDRTGLC